LACAPDGKWAVAILQKLTDPHLVVYPTGAGQPKPLPLPGLRYVGPTRFLPDSRRLLLGAQEQGHGDRVYLTDIEGAKPRAITPENFHFPAGPISADGKQFIARGPDQKTCRYPIEAGQPASIPGFEPDDLPVGWTADDRAIFVHRAGGPKARIDRLDLATGRRDPWREPFPSDAARGIRVSSVFVSPDGSFYAYAYSRVLSNLYLVEGLK